MLGNLYLLAPLHAAACTSRIALGPRAGQKVLIWKDPVLRLAKQEAPQPQGCVSAQGFSLHADTRCGTHQRQKLERLCWYITRSTKSPGPPRRILATSLISPPDSGSVPGADRSPLPIAPAHTHKGAPDWPDPRNMGRADPTHRMNARMSDSNVRKLNSQ